MYSNNGLAPLSIENVCINSRNHIFAIGAEGSGVFRSTDWGQNWTPVDTGLPPSAALTLTISKHDNLFVTTGEKAYRSSDNGDHWTPLARIGGTDAVDFQVLSDGEVVATITGTLLGVLCRSSDEGMTWKGLFGSDFIGSVVMNAKGYIFVASQVADLFPITHISRSTNDGLTWKDTSFGTIPLNQFAVDSSGYILIGGQYGYGSLRSTNDGDTWESLDTVFLGRMIVNRIGRIFASTYNKGPMTSTDGGTTWAQIGTGFPPDGGVWGFSLDTNGFLFAASWKGLFRSRVSTTSVTIPDDHMPHSYLLFQNYPNPFNPLTTISFSLPKFSHVKLSIYNVLGQLVQTVVNEKRSLGMYDVKVDGSKLTSGVYFYQIIAGNFVQTKKMVVIR